MFQLCKFLKVVGNLMVLVVIALLTSSYYSVVGLTLIPALKDDDRGWLRAVYGTVIGLYTVVVRCLCHGPEVGLRDTDKRE